MKTKIGSDTMPKEQWKIDANDRYQKVVSTIMGLATAALVLPVLYLRNFLSVPQEKPLVDYLCGSVYWSWVLLTLSIIAGTIYYYLSAKWIKHAWGQKTLLSSKSIENALDWTFWIQVLFFLLGMGLLVLFFVTYKVAR
jgi:hypothetical protein